MEQLKIRKRESIVNNSIIHLFLSFLFLYVEYAYRHHLSPLSLILLKKSFTIFLPQILFFSLTAKLIWDFHKYSRLFFITSIFLVVYKISEGIVIDFNKLIVVGFFGYLIVSFFLYQILEDYFQKAYFNRNYHSSDMFPPLLKAIPVQIKALDQEYKGYLTNWGTDGCFIKLNEAFKVVKDVKVEIDFHSQKFIQSGEVVAQSREMDGLGIKFYSSKKDLNVFNWAEFVELTEELGYQAERLR